MSKLQEALSRVNPPKVPLTELVGQTYSAQNVEVQPINKIEVPDLRPLVDSAGKYYESRELMAKDRTNEILFKKMTPEQMKGAREDGTLPYADDAFAMRNLQRALGRNEAFDVDSKINTLLKANDASVNTPEKANALRQKLMDDAQARAADYGFDNNSEYWTEGMWSNMVERNLALKDSINQNQDTQLKNTSTIAVQGGIDDALSVPMENRGKFILSSINQQRDEGIIRTPQEYEAALTYTLNNMVKTPSGSLDIAELAEQEIDIYGQKLTVGQFFGKEKMSNLTSMAERTRYDGDYKFKTDFLVNYDKLNSMDISTPEGQQAFTDGVRGLMESVYTNQPSNQTSSEKEKLAHLVRTANTRQAAAAKANKEALDKKRQGDNVNFMMDERVEAKLAGNDVPLGIDSFVEDEKTGKIGVNNYGQYFNFKVAQIDADESLSPVDKTIKKIRIGNLLSQAGDTSGFGAWYKAEVAAVQGEMDNVAMMISIGEPVSAESTPKMNTMMEVYKKDPMLFMQMYGEDASQAIDISLAQSMNIDYATLLRAKNADKKGQGTEASRLRSVQWQAVLDAQGNSNILGNLPSTYQNMYKAYYESLGGLRPAQAVEKIKEHANAHFFRIGENYGAVSRQFLQTDPNNPDSVEIGAAKLIRLINTTYGGASANVMPNPRGITVMDGRTGNVQVLTKEMFNKVKL